MRHLLSSKKPVRGLTWNAGIVVCLPKKGRVQTKIRSVIAKCQMYLLDSLCFQNDSKFWMQNLIENQIIYRIL